MYCPPSRIWYGILYALIGVWPPCSNAADAVITLAVDPGWNTFCTGMSVAWVARLPCVSAPCSRMRLASFQLPVPRNSVMAELTVRSCSVIICNSNSVLLRSVKVAK